MTPHGHAALADAPRNSAAWDARLARRLWAFIRPHQRWVWCSLALLLLISGLTLLRPWLIKLAIDQHLTPRRMEGFPALLAVFAGVCLFEVAGKSLQTWTLDLAGQSALLDLRLAVFRHLQRLSSSFYDRTPIGRLVGRVTTDVEALQEMFSSGVVTILGDLVFLIATVAVLFAMSWQLASVTMVVVPVLLVVTGLIRGRVRHAYSEMVSRRSRMNAYLHEQVGGMPLVQAFGQETATRDGFAAINGGMRNAQLLAVRWESWLSALTEMLGSFTLALILWYGSRLVLDPARAEPLTLGTLFAFIDYMNRFFAPLSELSQKYTVMQNAMTASERIFALLDEDAVTPEPARPAAPSRAEGRIAFSDVSFSYDGETPVLRSVSFTVEPGERVALVGATGAGKTSILKLLTRLYDPQSGRIELDDRDIRDYALRDLRRRVGIVPQDVFLFGGDILSNIRLGHPEITDEHAIAAADRMHLEQVVARFPRGYREPVRERGSNLSSGERQLIAFARVMAVAPAVLALDEATSNVDTNTEHLLQEAVHEVMRGRTSLIIAHRLSTIRDVDRILVLHKGELVEQGSHDELLARRGVYRRLHELQFA